MDRHAKIILTILCGITTSACENYVIMSPKIPVCSPPPIERNIVGVWNFESTYYEGYRAGMPKRLGVVEFTKDYKIIDPDSLFENRIDGRLVISKTYNPKVCYDDIGYKGDTFLVFQKKAIGETRTTYTVVTNDCDRIQINLFMSSGLGFILRRK